MKEKDKESLTLRSRLGYWWTRVDEDVAARRKRAMVRTPRR